MNVNSRAFGNDSTGVNTTISGVDAAVFTVESWHDWTANLCEFQITIGGDGANHQTKSINVSGKHNSFAVVFAVRW